MIRIQLLSFFLILVFGGSQAAVAQTEFVETEFDFANGWTPYGPFLDPNDSVNADFTYQQKLAGGNPDAYGEMVLTRATVGSGTVETWVALINDMMVWDPGDQASGPIGHVDLKLDGRRTPETGSRVLTIAVRQNGFVWLAYGRRVLWNENGWIPFTVENIVDEDFVITPGQDAIMPDQPVHPDFSADGAPIAFGIATGFSCPATSNCAVTAARIIDTDNLHVTVMPPLHINSGVSDAWYEPATAGQGFLIIAFPVIKQIFLAWFTFDTERPAEEVSANLGEPGHRWLTAQGPYEGDTAVLDVYLTEGGVFDRAEPAAVTHQDPVGEITLTWFDCNDAVLSYDLKTPDVSGLIHLGRAAADNIPLCMALSEED